MTPAASVVLLIAAIAPLSGAGPVPRLEVRGAVPAQIQAEASARGWEIVAGDTSPDSTRPTYLAGPIAEVLYAASRMPGAWTAALALGGNPRPALDSNRIFGANLTLVPVLWIGAAGDAPAAEALHARIPSVEFRPAPGTGAKDALDWLAAQKHEPLPEKVDCETGNPEFGRCYWAAIVKLDPAQPNDLLPSTRIVAGSGAVLALGGFSYDPATPGPGVLVTGLSPNYKGPLKPQDRIVALAGKPIEDGRHFRELLDQVKEEKPTAVLVQRGKERLRIETRIVLPKREETVTGRLQAEHVPDAHELTVITRGVGAFRVNVAPHWAPLRITWNGNEAGEAAEAGCWAVDETEKATRCKP